MYVFTAALAALVVYLAALSKHLQTRHPAANPRPPPSPQEYHAANSYRDIDMLRAIPRHPTHAGYAVIGGSGFLGLHLVQLLLRRGESNIRVLDLLPPPDNILSQKAVSFVRTDITSLPSLRAALAENFPRTGKPPTVIFHMAAIIRFWERAAYTWPLSYRINVQGTANVLAVANELPSVRSVIYTSSGDVAIPSPRHWLLGYAGAGSGSNVTISDEDDPLPEAQLHDCCYPRSKKLAEDLVRAANGVGNFKTAILRPGYTIFGVNDRMISSTLNMPRVPIFDKPFSKPPINAWDAVAAHLLLEQALEQKPDQVAGEAFLVTGPDSEVWTLEDTRNAVKHYSTRPLVFQDIPPLAIYIFAHVVEAFLYLRWHALVPFYSLYGRRPPLQPAWLGETVYLQPATLEYLADITIDDSRARKVLGYQPQWSALQTIKYVVDMYESGEAGSKHGLQLTNADLE